MHKLPHRIRFAAPPLGKLRWQAPQPPLDTNGSLIEAKDYGNSCVQQYPGTQSSIKGGNEDCLFINVVAPASTGSGALLPVFVRIHGGGYGLADGKLDPSVFLNANDNKFLFVGLQYRVRSPRWIG